MTEAQLYEKIGRQQTVIEHQDAAYSRLLELLASVIAGDTARSRVMVNKTDRTWVLAPEGFSPGMPATINGLPVCVAGVDDPTTCDPTVPAE